VHEQIRRLEVAVDDAGGVRVSDGSGGLAHEIGGLARRRSQPIRRHPRDKFEHEVRVSDVVDGDNVRVVQPCGEVGFAGEAGPVLMGGAREILDGDVAVEAPVAREPDLAEAALAQRADAFVSVGRRQRLASGKRRFRFRHAGVTIAGRR
jgi:hypothetical protein